MFYIWRAGETFILKKNDPDGERKGKREKARGPGAERKGVRRRKRQTPDLGEPRTRRAKGRPHGTLPGVYAPSK